MAPPTFDVYRETESFAIKDGHQMDTAGTQTSITKSIQGVPQFDVYKGEDTDSQKMEINKSQLKRLVSDFLKWKDVFFSKYLEGKSRRKKVYNPT